MSSVRYRSLTRSLLADPGCLLESALVFGGGGGGGGPAKPGIGGGGGGGGAGIVFRGSRVKAMTCSSYEAFRSDPASNNVELGGQRSLA